MMRRTTILTKGLKRDAEEIIDMYEDIPTHLEPVYSAKSAKVAKDIKKKRKKSQQSFVLIPQRRDTMRRKVKEANTDIQTGKTSMN